MKEVKIYLISDSVGETAKKLTAAVAAQFPNLNLSNCKLFPFTKDIETLSDILEEALKENAVVVNTLVDKEMVTFAEEFADRTGLKCVDFITPFTRIIEEVSGETSIEKSGRIHRMNQEYFERVAAMEFAVKYDDGKDPKGFLKADIVLLGVSRTSKTPLSIYLANRGYKVANLPIIPEVQVPKEIFQISPRRIVGLKTDPKSLSEIRRFRAKAMGLQGETLYSNEKRILDELKYADDLFERLGIMVINVSARSIEETSMLVENIVNG